MLVDQVDNLLRDRLHHEDLLWVCKLVVQVDEAEEGQNDPWVLENETLVDERSLDPGRLLLMAFGLALTQEVVVGDFFAILVELVVRVDWGLFDAKGVLVGHCTLILLWLLEVVHVEALRAN